MFKIQRDRLYECSFREFQKNKADFPRLLVRVEFVGEAGLDAGGLVVCNVATFVYKLRLNGLHLLLSRCSIHNTVFGNTLTKDLQTWSSLLPQESKLLETCLGTMNSLEVGNSF